MTTTTEEIVAIFNRRKNEMAPINAKRDEVRKAYNGDLRVVLPDVGRASPPAVANLLNKGVDQHSMRVASTLPSIFCPPRDEQKKREVEAANVRRKALYGWWEANDLGLMIKRRARHLTAYAKAPVMIRPDLRRGIPQWHMRDPFGTFPSSCLNPGDMTPTDCVFEIQQSYEWVRRTYSEKFERLYRREKPNRDAKLTVLEWVDDTELVHVVLSDGPSVDSWAAYTPPSGAGTGFLGSAPYVELERIPNRAGMCTAVIPGRVTLDRELGQFDSMLSLHRMMSHLTALELIAVEKGIFPDLYLESRPNEVAEFISGPHDGRTGLVNKVKGGTMREIGTNPGYQTNPTIDRLERNIRIDGGIPAEWGGESSTNIRTGKRGDAVLSAAVDFPIGEMQQVLATSLREENKRAIAVAKGYFGSRQQSFYVNWKGSKGVVDFVPNEVFTTDHNVVEYSHAGTDMNGLMILLGQAVGMEAMSKKTARELMPIIQDAEFEHDQTIKESIEAAILASVQQKANAGEIAPVDTAWLMQQISTNRLELAEAIIKLDERVQQRQQAAAAQQADPALADPMAGLATGTSAEGQVAPPAIGGPTESQDNLASLLGRLRMPQMSLPSERPSVA